jgi:hypothetical protein
MRGDGDRIARGLVIAVACLSIAGLCAELGGYLLGWPEGLVDLLSLSFERNVPTWGASSLLLLASAALAVSAERASSHRPAWWALSVIFLFMSLDEAIEIHEHLGGLIEGRGVLYFSWVIPAAVIVLVLGLSFLRFLARLDSVDRRPFVVAGAIYVGGALGMELPLGWWTERAGDDNLVYGLLDWIEETLELVGLTVFLLALRARLARTIPSP